jgi:hypothetical protein
MTCALCFPDRVHINRSGPNVYDMVNALCPKHLHQWEKWEELCGTPCYLRDDDGGLIHGDCVNTCRLTAVKAYFQKQAETEG